jgi:uncharacterized protein (TIGR00251 family)
VTFEVRLQPRASRSMLLGWERGVLKAKVNAPPVDGAANGALIEMLGATFKIAKGRIRIAAGAKSRNKVVEIPDADPDLERKIKSYVGA